MRPDLLSDDQRPRLEWDEDDWDLPEVVPHVEPVPGAGRWVRWFVAAVAMLAVALVLAAGATGWWLLDRVAADDAGPGEPTAFDIAEGETLGDVAQRLEADGFIDDAGVFEWYVGERGGLEVVPGFYRIRPGAHLGDVLGVLRTPPEETYRRVTFPEGFTVAQIASRLDAEFERM